MFNYATTDNPVALAYTPPVVVNCRAPARKHIAEVFPVQPVWAEVDVPANRKPLLPEAGYGLFGIV